MKSACLLLALLSLFSSVACAAAKPDFADFDRRARAGEHLNVVFFGCSLTWGANATDPMLTSFRGQTIARLEKKYPDAHFKFFDGAIGGTGSQFGLFRMDRDVMRHKPDLVYVDFSANDGIEAATPNTMASYEAIVRRIITEAHAPVVQVIFPFQWNVQGNKLENLGRRLAHLEVAKAYHTAVGDAIELSFQRVAKGKTTIQKIWDVDGVHPGDAGYTLFTDAAWDAFEKAIAAKQVCIAPEKMLYEATYMHSTRTKISTLGEPPAGWTLGAAHVVAAFFDFQMSRWTDEMTLASNRKTVKDKDGKDVSEPQKAERLKAKFMGETVFLIGEGTEKSAKYRVFIDGKVVEHKSNDGKQTLQDWDAGSLARIVHGNCHLQQVIAEGLDGGAWHTLEIEPIFEGDAELELRLESICVAGSKVAKVEKADR
jgi:lysophospholipase L1-like esterase